MTPAPLAVPPGPATATESTTAVPERTFHEFFAGGGMARCGLGPGWRPLFANDNDPHKGRAYQANWGEEAFHLGDIETVRPAMLPGRADLAWASFPCQDLSLAGMGGGLAAKRSGTFWPFHALMANLAAQGRGPALIVLENVRGALTSHGGRDFQAIGQALADIGYRFGALVIDAALFLPQSRPRLFIVALRADQPVPAALRQEAPDPLWHPPALIQAWENLSPALRQAWLWLRLPAPPGSPPPLADLIEEQPAQGHWDPPAKTTALLAMMSPRNREKVERMRRSKTRTVATLYRRTRPAPGGGRIQRAEVRADGLAGCLRTPAGGSSRQTLLMVEGKRIRSRLLTPRETARLMGLPDDYRLPERRNAAYHLCGDGLAVPVVRHLAHGLLEPLLAGRDASGGTGGPRAAA